MKRRKTARWSLRGAGRWLKTYASLLRKERKSVIRVGLPKRMAMWRRGFLGESYVIYNLAANDPAEYLSDYQRFVKTAHLNGEEAAILYNKLVFWNALQPWRDRLAAHYGLIRAGRLFSLQESLLTNGAALAELLQAQGRLVLKPAGGSGGSGIVMLAHQDGATTKNGAPLSLAEVNQLVDKLDDYLIVEHLRQGAYAARISPITTNTVRVLTMWDPQDGAPFIAIAVQRIGSKASYPVDNWTQGGLSARIDLDTGVLGRAVTFPRTGKLNWVDCHPDTQAPITGVQLPNWPTVRDNLLDMVRALPYLPYVGWDILIQDDGFKIIEGNHRSDVNLLQVHGPLLRDPRVRRFYQAHGVVS